MAACAVPILDSFSALADATRCRMLWLLEPQELTVGELCAVLQLPQSTVSRHLKTLADAGWVSSRRDGTSRYYALALDGRRRAAAASSGKSSRASSPAAPGVEQDARRLARVLAAAERGVAAILCDVGRRVGSAARGALRRSSSRAGAPRACCRRRGRSATSVAARAPCCRCWRSHVAAVIGVDALG